MQMGRSKGEQERLERIKGEMMSKSERDADC